MILDGQAQERSGEIMTYFSKITILRAVLDKTQQILDFQNWTFKSYFLSRKAGFTVWWQQFSSRESSFPEISSNFLSPFSLVNLVIKKSILVCA